MRCRFIFLLFVLFIGSSVSAQHLQLINDRGEAGVFMGYSSYNGDVASDIQFVKMNYGAFYKKQLNEYIGLRLNYEKLNIGASDANSQNVYDLARGFVFERDFHEITVLSELYFNRFITDRKDYRFSPYLGFGAGTILSANVDRNNFSKKTKTNWPTIFYSGKYFCFTLFVDDNFTDDEAASWAEHVFGHELEEQPHFVFAVYQLERCPDTERLHLQGYLKLKRNYRVPGLKQWPNFETAHFERRNGSEQEASAY